MITKRLRLCVLQTVWIIYLQYHSSDSGRVMVMLVQGRTQPLTLGIRTVWDWKILLSRSKLFHPYIILGLVGRFSLFSNTQQHIDVHCNLFSSALFWIFPAWRAKTLLFHSNCLVLTMNRSMFIGVNGNLPKNNIRFIWNCKQWIFCEVSQWISFSCILPFIPQPLGTNSKLAHAKGIRNNCLSLTEVSNTSNLAHTYHCSPKAHERVGWGYG